MLAIVTANCCRGFRALPYFFRSEKRPQGLTSFPFSFFKLLALKEKKQGELAFIFQDDCVREIALLRHKAPWVSRRIAFVVIMQARGCGLFSGGRRHISFLL
jgi:hypothetical protein